MPHKLKNLKLAELSLVDNPANPHAKVAIFKRADPNPVITSIIKIMADPADGAKPLSEFLDDKLKRKEFQDAMEEFWPFVFALESSLQSIIGDRSLTSETKMSMMRSTMESFLSRIGEKFPDIEPELMKLFEEMSKGEEDMPAKKTPAKKTPAKKEDDDKEEMTVEELQAKIADMQKQLEAAEAVSEDAKKSSELQAKFDELERSFNELNDKLEKAEAEKDEALAKADFSDEEKAYFETIKEDKDKDDFIEMSKEDRTKLIKKSAEDDESIEVEGRTILKSVVGEDQFEIFKSMAERLNNQEEVVKEERDKRELVELAKQAKEDFGHLPGTPDEKAAVLKAAKVFDKDVTETFTQILTAAEKMAKSAFDTLGTLPGKDVDDKADGNEFNKKVAEIKARDKCTSVQAMQKAQKEYPEAFEAYQEAARSVN